ncbi:hypothetical protein CLM62_06700 [Streptomyces sp. SA15]|uniref:hypothetical protein n=1 Tax=Streptomyces sp. SA15 TaxID=934019 RepID=UPI000BB03DBB|nr:hypothetical protein [Streptomyces sp. SA15]PAZ16628.1 hypothetical protein CLM62_06700 [Streptomyces sp. SA15]
MTQTARPAAGTEAPACPMTRACPYQMPVGYEELCERGPLTKVTLPSSGASRACGFRSAPTNCP